jgi:hypothetical protein
VAGVVLVAVTPPLLGGVTKVETTPPWVLGFVVSSVLVVLGMAMSVL